MKNSDLLLAANTLWVAQHGGTQGSPVSPLLLRGGEMATSEATVGKAHLRRPVVAHPDATNGGAR
jgi:hypothetical protein